MNRLFAFATFGLVFASVGCRGAPKMEPWSPFAPNVYLRLAEEIQALERPAAIRRLEEIAELDNFGGVVLCRMLFEAREGREFRAPRTGARELGGLDLSEWPLAPISVVGGVPFYVRYSNVTSGSGSPERAIDYLNYCLRECRWREERYAVATRADIDSAASQFLTDRHWPRPLSSKEFRFFLSQVNAPLEEVWVPRPRDIPLEGRRVSW
ncbi:MAG: hypothetical protein AAF517_16495 [Planctomycetota bacterium]